MSDGEVLGERFSHAVDLLVSKNDHLAHRIEQLEKCKDDHETRLRAAESSATQFKMLAGLATGGGLVSIIALIRSLAGG